ncbi:MAG TPA: response regulator [Azospirillaceae bacterium]|nr:response regulator [Azospirillaceae bacterium]
MEFDGSDLKVLVIEDNQHFRMLIRTVLQTLGIRQVHEAVDGANALDILKTYPADLVIADWKMEPMDGIVFAHRLRRGPDSPNPYLPIIMVTGYSEARLVHEARDAGINEFLAKPISAKSLISRVVAVMSKPRPFVRTGGYFGPDRRRRQVPWNGEERRRTGAPTQPQPPRK